MKDFKIGDRVRDISVTRRFGTITSVNHYGDPDCLVVRFDDDEEGVCYVKDLEIFPDPKTAFLEELKNLLEKYNVDIAVEDGGCNAALYAYFDGEVSIDFWCEEITRQGLKDKQYTIYDKE